MRTIPSPPIYNGYFRNFDAQMNGDIYVEKNYADLGDLPTFAVKK